MPLLPIVLVPLLVTVATAAERRLGPAAAGAVAAAPVLIAAVILSVGASAGAHAASALALSAAGHLGAQVLFAAAFTVGVRRRGAAAGLLAGVGAYVAVSIVTAGLPVAVAIALGALSAALACAALTPPPALEHRPARGRATAVAGLRASVAALGVTACLVTAHLAGPAAAGVIAAFPVTSSTMAVMVTRAAGISAGRHALDGLLRGLAAYGAFCVVAGVTATRVGVPAAVGLGVLACALTTAARQMQLRPMSLRAT